MRALSRPVPFLDLAALHEPIKQELDDAIARVTASGQFVGGEFLDRFETEWAEYCGARHAVGVSNGTDALELALRALGLEEGDEVIVPANTFIATWEAIVAARLVPVPIDVDPQSLLATADAVERACTNRTAAILVVHLFGHPVDMDAVMRLAERHRLFVVEDAAQAHGAIWNGRRIGSIGDAGCFSFYPGKNLGAFGDAGAVVTSDPQIAARVRALSNHGRSPTNSALHELIGSNGRLDGIQSAILSAKLPYLDGWNARRRDIVDAYARSMSTLPVAMPASASTGTSSCHLAVIQTEARDAVRRTLAAKGIGTGVHYPIPCHRQPAFASLKAPPLPVTERAAERILSLPLDPSMTLDDVSYVVAALEFALADRPRPAPSTRTRPFAEPIAATLAPNALGIRGVSS